MVSSENLEQITEQEQKDKEKDGLIGKLYDTSIQYFTSGIGFVKWTTTISVAAIAAIGFKINSSNGKITGFLGGSILCFILSILVAIFVLQFVLTFWAGEMNRVNSKLAYLCALDEKYQKFFNYPEEWSKITIAKYIAAEKQMSIFRNPSNFASRIFFHLFLFEIGLCFFALSLVFG
jgi:hypothetical protein